MGSVSLSIRYASASLIRVVKKRLELLLTRIIDLNFVAIIHENFMMHF